jgi:hypothetical protein
LKLKLDQIGLDSEIKFKMASLDDVRFDAIVNDGRNTSHQNNKDASNDINHDGARPNGKESSDSSSSSLPSCSHRLKLRLKLGRSESISVILGVGAFLINGIWLLIDLDLALKSEEGIPGSGPTPYYVL